MTYEKALEFSGQEERLRDYLNNIFGSPAASIIFSPTPSECGYECVLDFYKKYSKKKKKCLVDELLTSQKFKSVQRYLRAGESYEVYLVPINEKATYEEALLYMSMKGYIFMGPEMLLAIQDRFCNDLPKNAWIYSIDLEKDLLKDVSTKLRRIPCVINYVDYNNHQPSEKTRKEKTFEMTFSFAVLGFNKGEYLLCAKKS